MSLQWSQPLPVQLARQDTLETESKLRLIGYRLNVVAGGTLQSMWPSELVVSYLVELQGHSSQLRQSVLKAWSSYSMVHVSAKESRN